MVGPYGGITAAITLQAVMQHPNRLGEPTALTVYRHADHQQLAESGSGYPLGQVRGQGFRNGFFDQSGLLWNEQGLVPVLAHHRPAQQVGLRLISRTLAAHTAPRPAQTPAA